MSQVKRTIEKDPILYAEFSMYLRQRPPSMGQKEALILFYHLLSALERNSNSIQIILETVKVIDVGKFKKIVTQ